MSDEPKTVEMPAADPVLVHLTQIKATLAVMSADVETVKNEGQRTNMRLTRLEVRTDDVESRLVRHSDGTRSLGVMTSQNDLEQAAQLAQERAAREALATKVDTLATKADALATDTAAQTVMLGTITGLLDKPIVKQIGSAFGGLLLAALALATGYLARGCH